MFIKLAYRLVFKTAGLQQHTMEPDLGLGISLVIKLFLEKMLGPRVPWVVTGFIREKERERKGYEGSSKAWKSHSPDALTLRTPVLPASGQKGRIKHLSDISLSSLSKINRRSSPPLPAQNIAPLQTLFQPSSLQISTRHSLSCPWAFNGFSIRSGRERRLYRSASPSRTLPHYLSLHGLIM